jgi:hypothetical protein
LESGEHHHRVEDFRVTLKIDLSIFIDVDISHEHVSSWNPNILENAITIIFSIKSKLRADITDFNPGEGSMSLDVSNWNEESLDSHLLSINN